MSLTAYTCCIWRCSSKWSSNFKRWCGICT